MMPILQFICIKIESLNENASHSKLLLDCNPLIYPIILKLLQILLAFSCTNAPAKKNPTMSIDMDFFKNSRISQVVMRLYRRLQTCENKILQENLISNFF